jgi:hypothetical protein
MLEEVAFTWKLIKQFHLRANATDQHPNAETHILLTKITLKGLIGANTITVIDALAWQPRSR